jgi:antimicrobial peptide system SdpB family protein
MKQLVERLKNKSVHNEKLAIARFLLALCILLSLLFNDMNVIANHNYTHLQIYKSRHNERVYVPLKKADLFMILSPAKAKVVVIIILLCVMSGFLPQVTCLLQVWACFSVHNYFLILNGGDQIAFILSILLVPICLTDPRLNQWTRTDNAHSRINIFANIAFFAIQVQAAIVYLDSGISKLFVKEWQEGTAVYYFTSHYRLGAPDWLRSINELITLTPFVAILSWGVILLELLLFACLFAAPKVKKAFLILALAFHLLIVIDFGLITFFLAIAALLILYLDDENNSVKLLHRLIYRKRNKRVIEEGPILPSMN